ncbi:VanW family protein [Cytobacillus gottheilii]|uniref:VanW family protein n=1 Tax=Cytobacillus gottheilii TaxID=859144 RepID=UPI0009BA74EB|nr:VanW family protein [Cytobacillus gottheilii]
MIKATLFALLLSTHTYPSNDDLIINYQNKPIVEIQRAEYEIPLSSIPLLNIEQYNTLLRSLETQICVPPANAYIGEYGQVIEEKIGVKLHREKFAHLFSHFFYNHDLKEMDIPTLPIHPRVDSDLLLQINVKVIGQYVTYFNSRNNSRTNNITLAAKEIDNTVVFPGELFSFNQSVGMRTKSRGFQRAPVIVRGELSEDIGGGICQVSSTLFNAVDQAGLSIVERYSHSKRVHYVPPGRDATVSWYGPDFVFQNLYTHPILLRAKVYGGQMVVKVLSSDEIDLEPRKVPKTDELEEEQRKLIQWMNER